MSYTNIAPAPAEFISTIVISNDAYPLYNHLVNPTVYFFSLEPRSIYQSIGSISSPAALNLESSVGVTLQLDLLRQLQPPYFVTASLGSMLVFNAKFGIEIFGQNIQNLTFRHPTVDGYAKALPWRICGNLRWTLNGATISQPQYITTTPIEVYYFDSIPAYLDKSGIPLALLRLENYLPAWMRTSGFTKPSGDIEMIDWPSFVVQSVFNDNQLEYEQWGGMCRYTSWDSFETLEGTFTKNSGLDFWLDLWTLDKARAEPGTTLAVNCYDLAGLCQVLISLGIDSSTANVRMKYMAPYGFIQATHLIGRNQNPADPANPENLCNNPFYGNPAYAPQKLVPDDSPWRSAFGNHMFLTIAHNEGMPHVYDACCGPQCGSETLITYPNSAIERTPSLYQNLRAPGTIADIFDGPGVHNLIISQCFDRNYRVLDQSHVTLLDSLASNMQQLGDWREPYLTAPAQTRAITASCVLTPKPTSVNDPPEAVTVNILKFNTLSDLLSTYQYRYDSMLQRMEIGPGEVQNDVRRGSIRMFKDEQRLYLATIDARHWKATSTLHIRNALVAILTQSLPIAAGAPPTRYIESITKVPAEMPQCRGTRFMVTVQVSP